MQLSDHILVKKMMMDSSNPLMKMRPDSTHRRDGVGNDRILSHTNKYFMDNNNIVLAEHGNPLPQSKPNNTAQHKFKPTE